METRIQARRFGRFLYISEVKVSGRDSKKIVHTYIYILAIYILITVDIDGLWI